METKKAKKTKKELTTKQRYTRYKVGQWSCFGAEFLSTLLPFIIIGAVNYEEYFVTIENGTKVSFGFALALAVCGIAVWLVSSKKTSNISDGFIALIVGWYAIALSFYLIGTIILDISMIMFIGGLGLLGAFGLNIASKNFEKKANLIKEATETATKENLVEEVKNEQKNKKENKLKGLE